MNIFLTIWALWQHEKTLDSSLDLTSKWQIKHTLNNDFAGLAIAIELLLLWDLTFVATATAAFTVGAFVAIPIEVDLIIKAGAPSLEEDNLAPILRGKGFDAEVYSLKDFYPFPLLDSPVCTLKLSLKCYFSSPPPETFRLFVFSNPTRTYNYSLRLPAITAVVQCYLLSIVTPLILVLLLSCDFIPSFDFLSYSNGRLSLDLWWKGVKQRLDSDLKKLFL